MLYGILPRSVSERGAIAEGRERVRSMSTVEQRVKQALDQVISYWYLYMTEGKASCSIKEITPLVEPLYRIKVELVLWMTFTFDALYIDGEQPSIFIDAYMLSHFSEYLIKNKTEVLFHRANQQQGEV